MAGRTRPGWGRVRGALLTSRDNTTARLMLEGLASEAEML